MADNKVFRSIEAPGGQLCVDIFRRPDGRFGYAEYRRDPEDGSGWYPTGIASSTALSTADAALAAAMRDIPWLAILDYP